MADGVRYRGQIVADDEWCPDCGESLPCSCDDMEDGWFADDDDDDCGELVCWWDATPRHAAEVTEL